MFTLASSSWLSESVGAAPTWDKTTTTINIILAARAPSMILYHREDKTTRIVCSSDAELWCFFLSAVFWLQGKQKIKMHDWAIKHSFLCRNRPIEAAGADMGLEGDAVTLGLHQLDVDQEAKQAVSVLHWSAVYQCWRQHISKSYSTQSTLVLHMAVYT